jgi:hypothetical protein
VRSNHSTVGVTRYGDSCARHHLGTLAHIIQNPSRTSRRLTPRDPVYS